MKNVRCFSLALITSAVLILSSTQSAAFPAHAQTDDQIKVIRNHYATINKRAARYKKVNKELSGFSLEGGTLVGYFDGPKLMKLVATHMGEGGKAVEEYYFWDNQLIFIYRKDSTYDKPMSGKVVSTLENRYYFDNNRLIRWIDHESKQIASDNGEYLEQEKHFLKLSGMLADGARSKKPTIEDTP